MANVKPKKALGQHFLRDKNIAAKITAALTLHRGSKHVLEIGPGTGVLTTLLLPDTRFETTVVEIDTESVAYLKEELKIPAERIIEGDFLQLPLTDFANGGAFGIIGNFPYNISSQIFFKVFEQRNRVNEVVCMIQKEVAERIAAKPGGKVSGILSILMQAFYEVEYLFSVPPGVFNPPPKVNSAVIRLRRNTTETLECSEKLFVQVVKQGFNNRRKTLRNALKPLSLPESMLRDEVLDKRAEQLGVKEFVQLTKKIGDERVLAKEKLAAESADNQD